MMSIKTKEIYLKALQWFGFITLITLPFTVAYEWHIMTLINACLAK